MPTGIKTRETTAKFVWGQFQEKKDGPLNTNPRGYLGRLDADGEEEEDDALYAIGFDAPDAEYAPPRTRRFKRMKGVSRRGSEGTQRKKKKPVAVNPTGGGDDFVDEIKVVVVNTDDKVVQVLTKGVWVLKKLAPNVCEATIVQRTEDMGNIPIKIFNRNIGRFLKTLTGMYRHFQRNGVVVDKEIRDMFIRNIPRAIVTEQVSDIVDEQLSKVDANDDKWEPLVKDSSSFVKLSTIHREGQHNSWGRAETVIDTSAEALLAYFWDYCR